MEEKANAALLVRSEEAAELAREHARAGRPQQALQAAAQSVDLLRQAGVDVAAWVKADRRRMLQ